MTRIKRKNGKSLLIVFSRVKFTVIVIQSFVRSWWHSHDDRKFYI